MSGAPNEQPFAVRRPPGADDRSRVFNLPGVVTAIFVANVLVFLALLFIPYQMIDFLERGGAVSPERFLEGPSGYGGVLGMIGPLFLHMFVHASFAHLGLNAMFLLAFGTPVARRMRAERALSSPGPLFRAFLFVLFYGLCGAAGALTYIALHTNDTTLLVGASGGIFGLWGAVARLGTPRTSLLGPEYARISALTSPVVIVWTLFVIVSNLAIGLFGDVLGGGGANVAWEAHIGGYLFGLLFYPAFDATARAVR